MDTGDLPRPIFQKQTLFPNKLGLGDHFFPVDMFSPAVVTKILWTKRRAGEHIVINRKSCVKGSTMLLVSRLLSNDYHVSCCEYYSWESLSYLIIKYNQPVWRSRSGQEWYRLKHL